MKKPSILLKHCLPVLLFSGCTVMFAESDPEPAPRQVTAPDAGMQQGDAGAASDGEAGAGAVLPGGGAAGAPAGQGGAAGGQGGALSEDPAGGSGGATAIVEGLGEACEEPSTCSDSAPACPAAAGYCTFYCDEAWVNGWREVPARVARCTAQGGECTPIGEERSYCVP